MLQLVHTRIRIKTRIVFVASFDTVYSCVIQNTIRAITTLFEWLRRSDSNISQEAYFRADPKKYKASIRWNWEIYKTVDSVLQKTSR